MHLYLNADLQSYFPGHPHQVFESIMQLSGEVYRHQKGRKTERIKIGDHTFFIKKHYGCSPLELIKNFLRLRTPVYSAKPEWVALQILQQIPILAPEVVAYGEDDGNLFNRRSFVLMREVAPAHSLDQILHQWQSRPPLFKIKIRLIKAVAEIARKLHQHAINHRDFYLCHFLLMDSAAPLFITPNIALIDLHRAKQHIHLSQQLKVKDLG